MYSKSELQEALRKAKEVKRRLDDQERRLKALGTCSPQVQSLLNDVRREKQEVMEAMRKIASEL